MITERKRGDTWKFVIWVADSIGNPITDFTDFEAWLTIKKQDSDEDEDAVAQVTLSGGGIEVDDADIGKLVATVESEVTSECLLVNHLVDVQIKDDTGYIQSTAKQTIKVVSDITRAT